MTHIHTRIVCPRKLWLNCQQCTIIVSIGMFGMTVYKLIYNYNIIDEYMYIVYLNLVITLVDPVR